MGTSAIDVFLAACEPRVLESIEISPRGERLAAIPTAFATGPVLQFLHSECGGDALWLHQAKALELIEARRDVVIATSTASGKSVPFQAAAIREMGRLGTVVVFYPQKALLNDQLSRWQDALESAGLSPSLVAAIHGDVPAADRLHAVATARILLITPDAAHAWLMRNLSTSAVRSFLRSLRTLVIDEAHTFEGVFGSNCAFLFRRMRSAIASLNTSSPEGERLLQFIAATATVAKPADHLFALTGRRFAVVGEDENGAPRQGRQILHVDGPSNGRAAEALLADYATQLASVAGSGSFIAFADKRQGVERVSRDVDLDQVLPYRSGYEQNDRVEIERALRSGHLKGVVSTSALELGIDISHFRVGLNLGVPMSRKAALQRIGRVGRSSDGVFAFLAPADAFLRFGSSLEDFLCGPMEPCHLYLENHLIQFQQACCLRDEVQGHGGDACLPDNVEWPEGFAEIFDLSCPGAPKPDDIDRLAMLSTGAPHLDYPLRHIAEPELAIRHARSGDLIGRITKDKAMREAFPGAIYLHQKCTYRVLSWKTTGYESTIAVEKVPGGVIPKPLFDTIVNVSHDPLDLIDGNLLCSAHGSIAETCMRVVESVYGYTVLNKPMPYSMLSERNQNMRSKYREFATTGIAIRVNRPWFKGASETQVAARRQVAIALTELLTRDHNVSAGDVRWAHTGVVQYEHNKPRRLDDAIVIFDDVKGGLRFTAPLFTKLSAFIDRLIDAADRAGDAALLSKNVTERLSEWLGTLAPSDPAHSKIPLADHERMIFAPGSLVKIRLGRSIEQRALLQHEFVPIGDTTQLMYRYELKRGATGWVPHDLVEPVGEGWRHVILDTVSGDVREIAA